RPMFSRCAISATDMRTFGESANPRTLVFSFWSISLPNAIHINPQRARHRARDRARPRPIPAFAHNSADLDSCPEPSGLIATHAVCRGSCRVQQLKGICKVLEGLEPPARDPFAMAQHEPVRRCSPLHHPLGQKPCQCLCCHWFRASAVEVGGMLPKN